MARFMTSSRFYITCWLSCLILASNVNSLPSHGAYLQQSDRSIGEALQDLIDKIGWQEGKLSKSTKDAPFPAQPKIARPVMNFRSISDELEEIPGEDPGPVYPPNPPNPPNSGSFSTAAMVALAFMGTIVVATLSFFGLRYFYEKFNGPGRAYVTINSDDLLPGGPARKVKSPTLDTIIENVSSVSREGATHANDTIAKGKEKADSDISDRRK